MECNTTIFDESEESIYNVTYLQLFGLLIFTVLVVISSTLVIYAILKKNNDLRNTNNLLIVNLLITDAICTVVFCYLAISLIVKYLANLDIHHHCEAISPLIL